MDDGEALERFCAEAYPELVSALAHHVGDRHLAEEFAQEALVRACDRWPQVRTMQSPTGWAFRVGANLASSHFRRRAAERRARQRHGAPQGAHRDADAADRLAVRDALQALTPRQREAILLRYFLRLDVEEAAQVLGASSVAVRGLTHRAIAALRDVLDVADDVEEALDAS